MKVVMVDDEKECCDIVEKITISELNKICSQCTFKTSINCGLCPLTSLNKQIFSNGQEAAESILFDPPDLLITDLSMPNVNGERLVNSINTNQTSTIVFSGIKPRVKLPSKIIYIPKPDLIQLRKAISILCNNIVLFNLSSKAS
jgi:CheY-like chemotaxis protein